VDAEGDAPLANLEVRAFAMSASAQRPLTRTDGSGAFALEGVNPGDSWMIMVAGDPSTHLGERRRLEAKPGTNDLGTIRLARGNVESRIKEGSWQGLSGVNNSEDNNATVLQARPGSPAERAGLKTGDVILAIDGKDMRGQGFGVVEYSLRGRPNSPITMKIQTPGQEPRTVTFNRSGGEGPMPASPPPTAAAGTATGNPRPAAPAQAGGALQPASVRTQQ
jgi:membrane-associated protease RseP (regulator of RpoE activity)